MCTSAAALLRRRTEGRRRRCMQQQRGLMWSEERGWMHREGPLSGKLQPSNGVSQGASQYPILSFKLSVVSSCAAYLLLSSTRLLVFTQRRQQTSSGVNSISRRERLISDTDRERDGVQPFKQPHRERPCAFLRITFIFSPCYCEMGSFHPSAAPHRRWETFLL